MRDRDMDSTAGERFDDVGIDVRAPRRNDDYPPDGPLHERYPHLSIQSPTAAAALDRYEVVNLRRDDHPYTIVPWGSPVGGTLGLLCRRPHDGAGPSVLVTFTAGGDTDVLPGLDSRTGDDRGKPIRLEGHQNPTILAALVDQALAHEAEEHP